jgi:hypothetical protein
MGFRDFTLEAAEATLGLVAEPGELFPEAKSAPIPGWLIEQLERCQRASAMVSERARSEAIVYPILVAAQENAPRPLAIFSGQRLDVEPALALTGECDYILALTTPLPRLRAPIAIIVEAEKGDVEQVSASAWLKWRQPACSTNDSTPQRDRSMGALPAARAGSSCV